jgi:hypothetical protein
MIFWLKLFDFIWKLHESCYKQLHWKWYATKIQYLINVIKFHLGFNYSYNFKICIKYARACDTWL